MKLLKPYSKKYFADNFGTPSHVVDLLNAAFRAGVRFKTRRERTKK